MIVCQCGNKIERLVVIALEPYSTTNRQSRPLVITDGLYFACQDCATNIVHSWEEHNKGRTEEYLIRSIDINVSADTKKEFEKRVLPQIIGQFKNIPPRPWYIPKGDIRNALKRVKKVKTG